MDVLEFVEVAGKLRRAVSTHSIGRGMEADMSGHLTCQQDRDMPAGIRARFGQPVLGMCRAFHPLVGCHKQHVDQQE